MFEWKSWLKMKIMILGDFSKSILMKFGLISMYISISFVSITELEGHRVI